MNNISVADLRRAITYIQDGSQKPNLQSLSDEEFLNCDFIKDLGITDALLPNIVLDLRRNYHLNLPLEIFKVISNNTVRSFLEAVNLCLEEANRYEL